MKDQMKQSIKKTPSLSNTVVGDDGKTIVFAILLAALVVFMITSAMFSKEADAQVSRIDPSRIELMSVPPRLWCVDGHIVVIHPYGVTSPGTTCRRGPNMVSELR